MSVLAALQMALPKEYVFKNYPLGNETTFKIGGCADVFVEATSPNDVMTVQAIAAQYGQPVWVIGNGSNLLIADDGVRGVVLRIQKGFSSFTIQGQSAVAQAGASLAAFALACCNNGLCGLSFAAGIPGTVGGAIYMNAGAYGGSIGDVLISAQILQNGQVQTLTKEQLQLNYRHSILQQTRGIVLSAQFAFEPGDAATLLEQAREYNRQRREKQPLEFPSAGSAFKRPPNGYAAQMIDEAGLKGTSVGGAMVSPKHAGFIINTGGATAQNVKDLIALVQQKVLSTDRKSVV